MITFSVYFVCYFEDEGVYIFFFIILDILHHIFGGRNGGDFKA